MIGEEIDLTTFTKLKLGHKPKCKMQSLELLEGKQKLEDFEFGNEVSDVTPKA